MFRLALSSKNFLVFEKIIRSIKLKVNPCFPIKTRKIVCSSIQLLTKSSLAGVVLRVAFLRSKDEDSSKENLDIKHVIQRADTFYHIQQYEQLYSLLYEHRKSNDDEILWRLARATYEVSKATTDKSRKIHLLEEGLQYVERALELNDSNGYCHKWYAILLDSVAEFKGTKEKITRALEILNHFKKAAQLIPFDATSHYLLGYWCYSVANLAWYERKLAAVIYGSPPSSTFEEALQHFEKAETVEPNFYSMNLLLLGKCYMKLNDKEKAIFYFKKTRDYPQKTTSDREAQKEAMYLLKKLK